MIHKLSLVPALLLAGLMLGPTPARAEVRDEGKFFSAEAVKKANARLKTLQEKTKKELRIDTFDRVPDPQRKDFEQAREQKTVNDFLHTWARSRARDLSIPGVYVLLCKEAGFQVEVSDRIRNQFTAQDRQKMADILREKIKPQSENNDAALESAVSLVEEKFKADSTSTGTTTPVTRKKPESNPLLGWICIALVVLLGVWLVIGVVRALSGGGGGGYGGGGGGGSFFGGLLAGMFGAAAGYWLYSNFFGGNTSSAWGGTPDAGGGTASGPDDYSGTGGTWGDSGGGGGTWGDSGGGGGGDWGGGDAGGGGDWGGDGGGGDWGGGGGGDW